MKNLLLLIFLLCIVTILSGCGVVSKNKYIELQYELSDCHDRLNEANNNIDEANYTIEELNSQIEDAQSYVGGECYDLYDMESVIENIALGETVPNNN